MHQIIQNRKTGQYAVIDESGNFIPNSRVETNKSSGQFEAYDNRGNLLATAGEKIDRSPKPEDDGFLRSFHAQAIKPLQDAFQDTLDRGDMGAHQAKLLVTGILSQLNNFIDKTNPLTGHPITSIPKAIHNNELPLLGPISQKMSEQLKAGNYRGALGTLFGAVAPIAAGEAPNAVSSIKKGISRVPEVIAEKTLPKVFPTSNDVLPEDAAAMAQDTIPRSVGQSTGNAQAQLIEQTHGGKVATDLSQAQKIAQKNAVKNLETQYFPNGKPSNINSIVQKKLAEGYFDAEVDKNSKYADFQTNHVEKNTIPVITEVPNPAYIQAQQSKLLGPNGQPATAGIPPTIQQVEHIQGPVFLKQTLPMAQDLKARLDAFKNGTEYEKLPQISKVKFNTISSTVDNLVQPTKSVFNGKEIELPVASYEKVKQIRSDIGKALSGLSEFKISDKYLSDIKNSLGADLQDSVQNYWGNGQQAANDLADANNTHIAFKQLFDKDLKSKIFKGNPNLSKSGRNMADPTTLLDDIGKSPVVAKQFLDALGPIHSKLGKGAVLDKLMRESFDTANQKFSPDTLINKIQSEGYRQLFTAAERSDIENLMRQFRTLRPEDLSSKAGITKNMMFHMALPGMGIAIGAMTGHSLTGALTGGALEVGLSAFARQILLNPKYARIAAQLPYAPAGSAKASLLQSQIMKGLAGTSVSVILKNGQKVPAQVNGEGKLKLVAAQ